MFYMHRGMCNCVTGTRVQGQGAGVDLHTNCPTYHPGDTFPCLTTPGQLSKTREHMFLKFNVFSSKIHTAWLSILIASSTTLATPFHPWTTLLDPGRHLQNLHMTQVHNSSLQCTAYKLPTYKPGDIFLPNICLSKSVHQPCKNLDFGKVFAKYSFLTPKTPHFHSSVFFWPHIQFSQEWIGGAEILLASKVGGLAIGQWPIDRAWSIWRQITIKFIETMLPVMHCLTKKGLKFGWCHKIVAEIQKRKLQLLKTFTIDRKKEWVWTLLYMKIISPSKSSIPIPIPFSRFAFKKHAEIAR